MPYNLGPQFRDKLRYNGPQIKPLQVYYSRLCPIIWSCLKLWMGPWYLAQIPYPSHPWPGPDPHPDVGGRGLGGRHQGNQWRGEPQGRTARGVLRQPGRHHLVSSPIQMRVTSQSWTNSVLKSSNKSQHGDQAVILHFVCLNSDNKYATDCTFIIVKPKSKSKS